MDDNSSFEKLSTTNKIPGVIWKETTDSNFMKT